MNASGRPADEGALIVSPMAEACTARAGHVDGAGLASLAFGTPKRCTHPCEEEEDRR